MEKTELTPELIFEEIATKSETPTTSICTFTQSLATQIRNAPPYNKQMVLNFDRIESNWHQKRKNPILIL